MSLNWVIGATSLMLVWLGATKMQILLSEESQCSSSALMLPTMKGLQVLSVSAIPQQNYEYIPNPLHVGDQTTSMGLEFCNVTITYTHPGWNDRVIHTTYLPSKEKWNGRFQANGGGGYITGGPLMMDLAFIPGLVQGYSVSTTDGGHQISVEEGLSYSNSWALSSPGNINWPLLVDFAHVSLHDMAILGKAVTKAYYGTPPEYSYFFGGSTGGRQGHMLAQRYPKDFDGIIALFPAMNWAKFLFSNIYPAFIMNSQKVYPPPCEIQAFQNAALAACDRLDGVEDGMISKPGLCHFDPHSIVGNSFKCNGADSTFSLGAANVVEAAWNGPRSATGEFQWYGFGFDANISEPVIGSTATECDAQGSCKAIPFAISDVWARYWVAKNPNLDLKTITHQEWDELFHASVSEYESVIGTSDPDLSEFRRAGGKMINWHGLTDQAIPVNGSVDYYDKVLKRDPQAQDFYRLYLAPGASHCATCGVVPSIVSLIHTMRDWVELGKAPETLSGAGTGPHGTTTDGIKLERELCMYPRVQHYVGGDATKAKAFICV